MEEVKKDTRLAISEAEFFAHEALSKADAGSKWSLAISGGGIRSATFALGVIQSLAREKLLGRMECLSTVSGGGYIGTWLSLWAREAGGIGKIEKQLVPPPEPGAATEEADEIRWLRTYGNFLAPENGALSPDSWLILAIWGRNTLLNLLVLVPFLAAALLTPYLYLTLMKFPEVEFAGWLWPVAGLAREPMLWLGAALGTLLTAIVVYVALGQGGRERGVYPGALLCLGSIFLAHVFQVRPAAAEMELIVWWTGGIAGLAGFLGGWNVRQRDGLHGKLEWGFWGRVVACAVVCAGTLAGIVAICAARAPLHTHLMETIWAAPLISSGCSLALILLVGTMGPYVRDIDREGFSRMAAWTGIFSAVGIVVNTTAMYGPIVVGFLYRAGGLAIATGTLWAAITGLGLVLARSPRTSGKDTGRLDKVLPLTAYVFLFGLLGLISFGVQMGMDRFHPGGKLPELLAQGPQVQYCDSCRKEAAPVDWVALWRETAAAGTEDAGRLAETWWPLAGLGATLLVFLVVGVTLPVNEFSLFPFYKNRLVRAYCGASNRGRGTDGELVPFTNLSSSDDRLLKDLKKEDNAGFLHILNTAANLGLGDTGLAERRAVSFAFTQHGCGYRMPKAKGRPEEYFRIFEKGALFSFGDAMTISGAAASPNMGYHSSPALAFLMTIFNVRLGYWFTDPAAEWTEKDGWRPQAPRWGVLCQLYDLFGVPSRSAGSIYLSDGGHFENLAVYELIARKRKLILCIDGEEDSGFRFEGLGGLVRKAQEDFGVCIDIDSGDMEQDPETGWSRSHGTVGRIWYPGDPVCGYLVYVKLSVTGDESQDVLTYRKANPLFPHQPTADQFFSESQFESYRKLGDHAGFKMFRGYGGGDLRGYFESLYQAWKPLPRSLREMFSKSAAAWDVFMKELQSEKELAGLAAQFSGGANAPLLDINDPRDVRAVTFCLRIIQLMENVFYDLRLSTTFEHPAVAGWMNQYRRWFASPLLRAVYDRDFALYSETFRVFCDREFPPKKR